MTFICLGASTGSAATQHQRTGDDKDYPENSCNFAVDRECEQKGEDNQDHAKTNQQLGHWGELYECGAG